jgi:hypothetical protein
VERSERDLFDGLGTWLVVWSQGNLVAPTLGIKRWVGGVGWVIIECGCIGIGEDSTKEYEFGNSAPVLMSW